MLPPCFLFLVLCVYGLVEYPKCDCCPVLEYRHGMSSKQTASKTVMVIKKKGITSLI